ncbi:hypothetical protein IKS_00026 [Bacillus cereus VDM062]|nr:hypothetical protein IKS_00026 [Bacillus cereus VDM062]
MATERELELAKQILAKLTAMDNRLDRLDGKMDSSEGIFKGIQATFEQGFADVRKETNEVIEIYKNRRSAKEIVEGIAGKGE